MKKVLFLLACVMAAMLPAQAQRLVSKQKGIEVVGSLPIIKGGKLFVKDNSGLSLLSTRYLKRENYTFMGLEYEQQNMPYRDYGVKLKDALLHLGYMHPLFLDDGKNMLLYGGISALGGYEELGEGKPLLPDGAKLLDRSRFVYDDALHFSAEYFLTDNALLLLKGQGRVLFGTDVRRFHPALSAGFKFNFQHQGTIKNKITSSIWVMGVLAFAVFCLSACDRELDVQQSYPFTAETMPVQKDIVKEQTAEIRCTLKREGNFADTRYVIRYLQPDGKGTLRMDNRTAFKPNDRYPLTKEVFRLYYTSASTDQQTIDMYVEDNFGQIVKLSFNFDNEKNEDTPEAIEKVPIRQ